jgi:signal transduction histidine kinase
VSQIARQTLGYYREVGSPVEVSIPELLENVLTVYHSKISAAQIDVSFNFESKEPMLVNKGEMLQIFSNVIANSIDSMPRGGKLLIGTRNRIGNGQPGIVVSIADTGRGITIDNLKKIFDPFFTTKGSVGTGLGLWVVKRLIEKRGGSISISSSTGPSDSGTTSEIFIPCLWPAESIEMDDPAHRERGGTDVDSANN